jgi:hypothetical protein
MNLGTHGQTQKNDVGKANAAMEDCACHPVATVIRIIPLAAGSSESFRLIRHGGECLPFAPRGQLGGQAFKSPVCVRKPSNLPHCHNQHAVLNKNQSLQIAFC